MIEIIINEETDCGLLVTDCPLRSDLHNCFCVKYSEINFCPESFTNKDGEYYQKIPDTCPLRENDVIIKFSSKEKTS